MKTVEITVYEFNELKETPREMAVREYNAKHGTPNGAHSLADRKVYMSLMHYTVLGHEFGPINEN